jgi:tetratricopeptide (TPR) repeat protein
LILDNVEDESPGELIPGGAASVLVTTQRPGLLFLRRHFELALELFTEEQCFDLFRQVLGTTEVAAHEAECRTLFMRIGRLPVAVSVLAALIKYDVRHTIASVAARLPEDATELIRQAVDALAEEPRKLLAAMAACAPEGFRSGLAASLIPLDEAASLDALQELSSRSLVEEIDRGLRRYRLHALVRDTADGSSFGKQHAEAVYEQFQNWEIDWRQCEADMADFQTALFWAIENEQQISTFSASKLASYGFSLTWRTGHLAEALDICERMTAVAEKTLDNRRLQTWLGNQALTLRELGGLEEALGLHKKEEALCLELGDKNGLQSSYGNQALILQVWGRLEEALALLKKQEALSLELGDKDALQHAYGNQAGIMLTRGSTEAALDLYKKQETLCLELGNKDSLQRCHGGLAVALCSSGRLEEAMALHKKEEALCLELGKQGELTT